jgi:hypothetical protein
MIVHFQTYKFHNSQFLFLFFLFFFLSSPTFAQTPSDITPSGGTFKQEPAKSQCVVTKVGNPAGSPPVLPPECELMNGTPIPSGGIGTSGSFTFPLKTTKSAILAGSTYGSRLVWCYTSLSNCHHDYNAADIFVNTGTIVVAAVPGIVSQAAATSSVGNVVTLLGKDNYTYYHAHMGSKKVFLGQTIKPGDEIGAVGTAADAVYTAPHLHFDQLPPGFNGKRPVCSGAACKGYPFINVQPNLINAYRYLP